MTKQFTQAAIPSSYQVRLDNCLCQDCHHEYECMMALDNVLVKFIDEASGEERWMPTFEKGGYLDLMSRLVPGSSPENEITMKDSGIFLKCFAEIQERPSSGGEFTFAMGCPCPKCGSRNHALVSKTVLDMPSLKWMRYLRQ